MRPSARSQTVRRSSTSSEAAFVTEPAFDHFFGDDYRRTRASFLAFLLDLRMDRRAGVGRGGRRTRRRRLPVEPAGRRPGPCGAAEQESMWRATAASSRRTIGGAAGGLRRPRPRRTSRPGHHYYLGVIASDPAARGRGHGAAVLRPGLEAADAAGLPTFLETGTEGNVGFYAGSGSRSPTSSTSTTARASGA